jgi:hypothetical protein
MYVRRNGLWSLVHEQFSFRHALVVKYWWQYLIFITTRLMNLVLNNSDMLKTQSARMANISCLHKGHEDCILRLLTSQIDGGMRRNHMIVSGVLSFTFFFRLSSCWLLVFFFLFLAPVTGPLGLWPSMHCWLYLLSVCSCCRQAGTWLLRLYSSRDPTLTTYYL